MSTSTWTAALLVGVGAGPSVARAEDAVRWQHPAGIVTDETLAEVKAKLDAHPWARETYDKRKNQLAPWLAASSETLRRVFPTKRGNVYHNFSCPTDRSRLTFDPFQADAFTCPVCGKTYKPDTNAGIYSKGTRYHGTMYDGWACIYYQRAGAAAADMGLIGRIEGTAGSGDKPIRRGIEILMLYADSIERIKTKVAANRQLSVLLTYHREGDNKVLNDVTRAYELLRDHMTAAQRARFERVVLQRMLDDVMLEPIYCYNHNNLYQWHRTIIQVGLSLERDDLIDWSFGYGQYDPKHQPEHSSVRKLIATHFKPDGAFWGMCSGYHLYPLHAFCELAVLSRHISRMDPKRFPPERYDLTDRASAGGKVIHNALHWFVSMAMPDRSMPTVGDSPSYRAGLDNYTNTAEIGYRYYGLKAVGDYEALRSGQRSWIGLLHGAPTIEHHDTSFTSSHLSSGWVSLRNEWRGNRVWVGLNALIPGSGHQHADRLNLVTYSHGKLLALEKATPYNESVTRVLGTLSPFHNTVTVDMASQPQGEALRGGAVPKVAHFHVGPVAKLAELHGDHVYAQTTIYRRSVALIEDVIVDLFRVRGGKTHDWMVHHAGTAPRLSMPTSAGAFSPERWLYNGTKDVLCAKLDAVWDARWSVDGVTSRLTMLSAPGTEVSCLETYPVTHAVITPQHPPCRTLCVRRHDDAPFLAVWDAWRDRPNLKAATPGDALGTLCIKTAANNYHMLFGPGEARFEDGVSIKSDAAFSLLRGSDAVLMAGGTRAAFRTGQGHLVLSTPKRATVSAECKAGVVTFEIAGDIHYDTVGGQDRYRAAPAATVTFTGDLWQVKTRRQRSAGEAR